MQDFRRCQLNAAADNHELDIAPGKTQQSFRRRRSGVPNGEKISARSGVDTTFAIAKAQDACCLEGRHAIERIRIHPKNFVSKTNLVQQISASKLSL